MRERGAALIEMLVVLAVSAVAWTIATRVVVEVAPRASEWEEVSAGRQTLRAIESRVARLASGAAAIVVDVDGHAVAVPPVWPRRLGFVRADTASTLSASAVTFLSRPDAHREVVLSSALAAGGGSVAFSPRRGCGSDAVCGFAPGDFVLAVESGGAAGLFRIEAAGTRLDLEPLMEAGASSFPPDSVIVPVVVDVIAFDAAEGALRRYDGYRSDNVLVDGVRSAAFAVLSAAPLGDGPFAGSGALAFDRDQLAIAGVQIDVVLLPPSHRVIAPPAARMAWRTRPWP